jgi:hypothetical protein
MKGTGTTIILKKDFGDKEIGVIITLKQGVHRSKNRHVLSRSNIKWMLHPSWRR